MEKSNPDFNETTDLYLQLLRQAQELEDPKLVAMIIDRLKKNTHHLLCTDSGCQIIRFPGHRPIPAPPPLEESRFWPRLASVQMAIILGCYLALVTAHTILS